MQSFSFQYKRVTVTANAKWFQHLKMGHFPNQSRLRNTTEPQNRSVSEIRHVEILQGGSYGSWLMFTCLQIWISKLLLSFTVFTPEDACEYLAFLKALNLSPCHYGYWQLADVQTRCKISQKALGGLQCLPSPLTIHVTHNWSSILASRFPFD